MAGKSTAIYSVKVAPATAEGGNPDLNYLPSISGETFVGMATTTATVDSFAGTEAFHEEEQGRRTPGENELLPVGVVAGADSFGATAGDFIRAMYDNEISLSARFRNSNGTDPGATAFGHILNSSMGLYSPAAASYTTTGVGADGGEFVVSDANAADIKLGAPVRVYSEEATVATFFHEYAIVTGKTDNLDGNHTVTVHPKFAHTPGTADTIQMCYAFYPVVGLGDGTLLNDLHVVFDMGGTGSAASVRRIASGCRMSAFEISNDNGAASLSMTVKPMVMLNDDGNASTVDTAEPAGKLLQHRHGARVDLAADHSAVASGTAASTDRTYLPTFDHSVSVSFDTAPGTPETRGVLRGGTHEIHNATCSVSVTTENSDDLQRLMTKGERRTLILGYGPGGTGTTGNGGAFIIKNAGRADGDANPSAGDGNRIQQVTALRAVSNFNTYAGTPADTDELNLASAPFLLVLPKA
jgi:hypothetical protein